MTNHLNSEEQTILDSVENNEFTSLSNLDEQIRIYSSYAKNIKKKNKTITLRINDANLSLLQKKSETKGLPYQTLINLLIQNYIQGKIKLEI